MFPKAAELVLEVSGGAYFRNPPNPTPTPSSNKKPGPTEYEILKPHPTQARPQLKFKKPVQLGPNPTQPGNPIQYFICICYIELPF